MGSRNAAFAAACFCALTAAQGAGAATLIGSDYSASNVLAVTDQSGTTVLSSEFFDGVVGAGVEFSIFGPAQSISVDLDAATITLRNTGSPLFLTSNPSRTLTLSNLVFGAGIGGVSVVENAPTFGEPVDFALWGGNLVAFGVDSVTVTLRGRWSGDANLVISLQEREVPVAPVPLPAAGLLLLGALAVLGGLGRRRTA